jgi:hypothetical protein
MKILPYGTACAASAEAARAGWGRCTMSRLVFAVLVVLVAVISGSRLLAACSSDPMSVTTCVDAGADAAPSCTTATPVTGGGW